MKQINNKTKGYMMVWAGFLMIVLNVIKYFVSDKTFSFLGIIGLVFVIIGMGWTKK